MWHTLVNFLTALSSKRLKDYLKSFYLTLHLGCVWQIFTVLRGVGIDMDSVEALGRLDLPLWPLGGGVLEPCPLW